MQWDWVDWFSNCVPALSLLGDALGWDLVSNVVPARRQLKNSAKVIKNENIKARDKRPVSPTGKKK